MIPYRWKTAPDVFPNSLFFEVTHCPRASLQTRGAAFLHPTRAVGTKLVHHRSPKGTFLKMTACT